MLGRPAKALLVAVCGMSGSSGVRYMSRKVLVLGGTGFVGNTFISRAIKENLQVVSVSRRGALSEDASKDVTWLKGDATDPVVVKDIVAKHGPFDACVHALGVLFDGQSGMKGMNIYVSGSKSIVDERATYDNITRETAFNAMEAIAQQTGRIQSDRVPFVFVSAAEAGWTFDAPVNWLHRYLIAKRAVESKLTESNASLRPVVMRPSLIWTWSKPEKVVATIPFFVGNAIGLPFIDRPVQVEVLADAMIRAIQSEQEEGIKNFKEMDRLARELHQQQAK